MNREEIVTKIQDEILKIQDECQVDYLAHKLIDEIFDEVEKLRQPISLADFLGWEEGVEYEYEHSTYKIMDNKLYHRYGYPNDWKWEESDCSLNYIIKLQQAIKVEPKLKAYHVKDEYSYNCLMKELEAQGYTWFSNIKPTEGFRWDIYKSNTVIFCKEGKTITYGKLPYYETGRYDLIEYHEEEPKYYAKIKGWELADNGDIYWNRYDGYPNLVINNTRESKGYTIKLTKSEWNKLGINDSNADFEEVEE